MEDVSLVCPDDGSIAIFYFKDHLYLFSMQMVRCGVWEQTMRVVLINLTLIHCIFDILFWFVQNALW